MIDCHRVRFGYSAPCKGAHIRRMYKCAILFKNRGVSRVAAWGGVVNSNYGFEAMSGGSGWVVVGIELEVRF